MHAHTWRELLFFIYSVYRAVCTLPGPQVGKNHQIKCPPPPRVFHLSPLQTSLSGEALQVITSCPEAPGPASLASRPGASPPQNWHYLEWGSRCAAHLRGLSLGRRAPCGPGCINPSFQDRSWTLCSKVQRPVLPRARTTRSPLSRAPVSSRLALAWKTASVVAKAHCGCQGPAPHFLGPSPSHWGVRGHLLAALYTATPPGRRQAENRLRHPASPGWEGANPIGV